MPNKSSEQRYFSLSQLAPEAGYKPRFVRQKLAQHPEIPRIGSGRALRISRAAWEALLRAITPGMRTTRQPREALPRVTKNRLELR